jgi:hypothetical protein
MRSGRLVDNHTVMSTACATFDWIDGSEVRDAGTVYPSDMVPYKPGTDVLLAGAAVPPEGTRSTKMAVSLRVVAKERILIDKAVDVYGPRTWETGLLGVAPTSPGPLSATPLVWENAYGGRAEVGGEIQYEPRNPVGTGFGPPEAWLGQPLPCIESPAAPLTSRHPAPAGFGPIGMGWQPRASRYGTTDLRWRRERAPLPPEDIDLRVYCSAPDDQWLEEPLGGGELFEVVGTRASGPWVFRLPMLHPLFASVTGGVVTEYRPPVDTVLVDAGCERLELTWRAAVKLPQKTEKLERIAVHYAEPLDQAWVADLAERYRAAKAAS